MDRMHPVGFCEKCDCLSVMHKSDGGWWRCPDDHFFVFDNIRCSTCFLQVEHVFTVTVRQFLDKHRLRCQNVEKLVCVKCV